MSKALLIDITYCVGCGACNKACKDANRLPGPVGRALSATDYTVLEAREGTFMRRLCLHCLHPACASACPVGALVRSPEGPVLYHEDKCMGCRYCMTACPHQVPTYEWNAFNPAVRKCILCAPRLQQGKPCACAAACPTEATTCGERDRLIRTAQARIESHPRRYHPHIYGVEEAGGTSVLFLAPVAFELLGLRTDLPTSPLPDGTATYLEAVPAVASFVVALMGGSWMLFKRRQEVHAVESQAQPEPETEPARSKEA